MSKVHQGNLPPTYRSMVKVIQRSRMYTTCLMVIHPYAKFRMPMSKSKDILPDSNSW